MEIQDLGALGEFMSSIAIIITLVFLTYEIRASRRHRDQYYSDLPSLDQQSNANVLTGTFQREPAFAKFYEVSLRGGVDEEFRQFADACHPTFSQACT